MTHPFSETSANINGPALGSFEITPHDDNDLPTRIRQITVGTRGTIAYLGWDGADHETAELPPGNYPVFASRILATGTNAEDLTGWI
jgi:hypothetical protein